MHAYLFKPLSIALVIACCFGACQKSSKSKGSRKREIPKDTKYDFGEAVDFGWNGTSDKYKRGGWGDTEEGLTWTTATSAKLVFTIPETEESLRFRMRLAGFVFPPAIPFQPVQVLVNDEEVAVWQVTDEPTDYVAIIPPDVNDHEQLIIELRVPRAASPRVLEIGNDPRTLGVSCSELTISETNSAAAIAERLRREDATPRGTEYKFNHVINFGVGGGARRYKKSGWHIAEGNYTWIGSQPAILEMTLPPTACPLILKMKLQGMTKAWAIEMQPTQVSINGRRIAEWKVGGDWEIFEAEIPPDVAGPDGKIVLELLTPKAVSPALLDMGSDKRVLGVRCEAMEITEEDEFDQPTPAKKLDLKKTSKDREQHFR